LDRLDERTATAVSESIIELLTRCSCVKLTRCGCVNKPGKYQIYF